MKDEIQVNVVKMGRKHLYLRYRDPETNRYRVVSSEQTDEDEARKAAGKLQAELNEGRYQRSPKMPWGEFVDHYSEHGLGGVKRVTAYGYLAALEEFQKLTNPQRLADFRTDRITVFVTQLRSRGMSEASIARHLRSLKRASRWANSQGLLPSVPKFAMPKQAKGQKLMRGRAITAEEFDRMIEATRKALAVKSAETDNQDDCAIVDGWKFLLRGLWHSGLRLSESLLLSWTERPGAIVVDFSSRRPLLHIPAEAEKGGRNRQLPITPDFAELLLSVPEHDRRGWVFRPVNKLSQPVARTRFAVGPVISLIGEKARIVVDERINRKRDKKGKLVDKLVRKYASAHDLRRAFGFRWSRKIMPALLRELMRHESIETTMQFYVGQNAEATADALWNLAAEEARYTSRNTSENHDQTRNPVTPRKTK